jgi:hypothetical protein
MADRKITAIAAPNAAGIAGMLDSVVCGGQASSPSYPRYPLLGGKPSTGHPLRMPFFMLATFSDHNR